MVGGVRFQRFANGTLHVRRIVGHEIRQIAVFGVPQPRFDRVEFRRIGRKPLEFEVTHPRSIEVFGSSAMHASSIKRDGQRPSVHRLEAKARFVDQYNAASRRRAFLIRG